MSKIEAFLQEIKVLRPNDSTKHHRALVDAKSHQDNRPEIFDVYVWKKVEGYKTSYKLQWVQGTKPILPRLKSEVSAELREESRVYARNQLTSGFNDTGDGMSTPELVVRWVEILAKHGIVIEM